MSTRPAAVGALFATVVVVELGLLGAGVRVVHDGLAEFVWSWGLSETSIALNYAVVGGVLAARRPRNPIGWLLLLEAWQAVSSLAQVPTPVAVPYPILLALVVLLFPHGRPYSRFWAVLAWLVALVAVVIAVGTTTGVTIGGTPIWDVLEPLGLLGLAVAPVSLVLRFRGGTVVERLQLKVLVWSALVGVVAMFTFAPLGLLPIVNPVAVNLIVWGIAVAVLRYRLYGLDRVISRTVSYTLLSVVLALVYVGVVLLMQTVSRQAASSDLAVAGATLVVAALFAPLRRRLQRLVDRRFNRARYDAEALVAAFAADLRDELAADVLVLALRDVVSRSLQPATVGLWTPRQSR